MFRWTYQVFFLLQVYQVCSVEPVIARPAELAPVTQGTYSRNIQKHLETFYIYNTAKYTVETFYT